MADLKKTLCDGPKCEKFHEMPMKEAKTQSAPDGWLSEVTLRVEPPKQQLASVGLKGDFCSTTCLVARIEAIKANWVKKEEALSRLTSLNLPI